MGLGLLRSLLQTTLCMLCPQDIVADSQADPETTRAGSKAGGAGGGPSGHAHGPGQGSSGALLYRLHNLEEARFPLLKNAGQILRTLNQFKVQLE